jgi:uncharacterized membrane protein YozB (DUF420 family)
MNIYTLIATIGLIFQMIVLVLLVVGYVLKRRNRFHQHGVTMLTAVVLHLIMIFALMVPSFVIGVIPLIQANSTMLGVMLAPIHLVTGTVAVVLGVWIVTSWRLRKSLEYCAPKKRIMLITLTLWVATLIIGIFLYLSFYTTLLSSP